MLAFMRRDTQQLEHMCEAECAMACKLAHGRARTLDDVACCDCTHTIVWHK